MMSYELGVGLRSGDVVVNKSFAFAIRIVKLNQYLTRSKKEYVLSKQLLRSGTSVGAMVREAQNAESKADFIHKLAIAQKECDESMYWIELMKEGDYLTQTQYGEIHQDAQELLKIIRSIILSTKENMQTKKTHNS